MVKDLIFNTQNNIKKYKIKNLNDVYEAKSKIVDFSKRMRNFDKNIKIFLRKKMYYHKKVKKNTNDGKKIIRYLFATIRNKPSKFINVSKFSNSNLERSISDFIAGMTDRYAINLYKKLK